MSDIAQDGLPRVFLDATLLHQLGLHDHRLNVPGHKRLAQDYGDGITDILA